MHQRFRSFHSSTQHIGSLYSRSRHWLLWGSAIALLGWGSGHSAASSQTPITSVVQTASSVERPTLRLGSQGDAVMELQAVLKLLGYYTGAVDGQYQASTAIAVTTFQQAAGLATDGIVGGNTWDRLLPSAPVTATASATMLPAADPATVELPTLRLGMRGSAVSRLQERLRAAGFFAGAIDGVFGSETQAAVMSAQRRYQLNPDGIVGAATWTALLR